VRARAVGATRLAEIDRKVLQALVRTEVDLADVLLGAFTARRAALIAGGFASVVIVGSPQAPGTLQLQEFLTRNARPYVYLDLERDPPARALLEHAFVEPADLPVVVSRGKVVKRPTIEGVAACLGLDRLGSSAVRDLVVVGAGPRRARGGGVWRVGGPRRSRARGLRPGRPGRREPRIENYLGFPTGISGNDLAARAFVQAEKFRGDAGDGAARPRALDCDAHPYRVQVNGETVARARSSSRPGAE
jgi:thioredoxin reductase (NADPH)